MGFLDSSPNPAFDMWSVADLTGYIREMFEIDFRLQDVEVTGEISNFTRARSGHLYFTLKDEQAQLKCVMWRSSAERLRFRPQEGDAVVAHGRVSVYEASGVYQLYADRLEPAGRGGLALAFEQLKEKLSAEGLFDPAHKQPIPGFPRKIGIVTSADAAALRDILNVLRRRYPLAEVLIAPTLVQGDQAPPQIVRALQWLDGRDDIDTLIVARGGGSIEDLWAFNDERVARAIFAARHPVISGVGHETDFTMADFVADLRAPTPSAAAELAVPDLSELRPALVGIRQGLARDMLGLIADRRREVGQQQRMLTLLSPRRTLDDSQMRVDQLIRQLDRALAQRLNRARHRVAMATAQLSAVSPQATLDRGYAIVRNAQGDIVRDASAVQASDPLQVQLGRGSMDVEVTKTHE